MDPHKQGLPVLNQHPDSSTRKTVKDPVCGMDVVPETAAGSVDHDGQTYHFCCRHCVEKFRADPARYLGGHDGARAAVEDKPVNPPPGATYTCPMHPEIVRDQPGSCPICGMALEPTTVSADADVDPELADMTRRFWSCLVLTVPLLILSMAEMIPGMDFSGFLTGRTLVWIQFALAAPVVLWGGLPFFERGWASLASRNLNMFTLIARYRRCVSLQCPGSGFPQHFPGLVPRSPWWCRGLFRAGRSNCDACPAGPGARAQSSPPDR